MSRLVKSLVLLLAPLLFVGCRRDAAAPAPPAPPAASSTVTPPAKPAVDPSPSEIKSLADSFLQDYIHGARHAAYTKMSGGFRRATTETQFGAIADTLDHAFGTLLDAKYKSAEMGTNISFAGVKKIWTLWYAVRTSTAPKGKYFARIDLVADPDLGVQAFQIATFPLGRVPPNLQ